MEQITKYFAQPVARWIALGLAVVVIGAGTAFFLLPAARDTAAKQGATKVAHAGDSFLVDAANAAAASETGGLCDRALIRAQGYGVVPDGATLSGKETPAAMERHFTCQAQTATGAAFTLAIEQTCDDLSDHNCIALNRVTGSDGTSLFERQM